MKVVKIIGGLGNQMFQYAFFLFMKKEGINAKIDITDFDNYTLHNGFELKRVFGINIRNDIISQKELNFRKIKDNKPFFGIRKIIDRFFFNSTNYLIQKTHWVEPNYSAFYNEVIDSGRIYMEGYWQNEKYLIDQRNTLIKLFEWKTISKKNVELIAQLEVENSVSVHIRRFDQPKSFKELFYRFRLKLMWRIASKKYYLRAIDRVRQRVSKPVFYVFTDNISWVKQNFFFEKNVNFVDWNRGEDSNQDMLLMSKCKHNIISMSSFSWWGAWLNQNPNKIVIAPRKWAVRFKKDMGIIPSNWTRI
ncbi:alpha-1,2-fucosyltransferase [Maribellus maritimus]|uniref:alpha-1,2-fucosyltransferase n=1 Tax=Maribellus maritimus TaxID=2870838 RepID=UPI001EEC3F98|nr:alpha-1,2-fucosyltransferase [Maribellus maritimus]MCG6191229.1 alpha-1,2-fucosyltransferase [Maribellus maritimus]